MPNLLLIFPIALFIIALLALLSGIGVVMRQKSRKGGMFTTFVWTIFSASVCMGFVLFGVFIISTQQNVPLAILIGSIGFVMVLLSAWIAMR